MLIFFQCNKIYILIFYSYKHTKKCILLNKSDDEIKRNIYIEREREREREREKERKKKLKKLCSEPNFDLKQIKIKSLSLY